MILPETPNTTRKVTAKFNPEGLEIARRNAGLKQTELADIVGVNQSAISLFESGVKQPSGPTVAALSHVLNTPLTSLYFFEEK